MKLLKCMRCGALVQVIDECKCNDCGIMCCNEPMKKLKENSVDASFEKHVPNYNIIDNKIEVEVNHVMESEHYIEFISLEHDNIIETVNLKYTDLPKVVFNYYPNSILYSYCNKHGLWKIEVK